METKRLVTINYLDPKKMHMVKKMNGDVVVSATGAALLTKGFMVGLDKMYDSELFEISQQ
jgi:hypothetical protein